jgi:Domain of unknown function (DUF397)
MRLYEFRRPKRAVWRRSSFCAAGECAELVRAEDKIFLRSSHDPKVIVKYSPEEFRALRLGFQAGEFDDLA